MPTKPVVKSSVSRRIFNQEFSQETVQMLPGGHSASSIAERLVCQQAICGIVGIENSLLRAIQSPMRWTQCCANLRMHLRRVEREGDILK